MQQILDMPEGYEKHLQRYAASVATSVAYGRRVESVNEWIVKENMESMDYLTRSGRYFLYRVSLLTRLSVIMQCEVGGFAPSNGDRR